MEDTFYNALDTSPDELLSLVVKNSSRPSKAALKAAIHKCSKKQAVNICVALSRFTDLQINAFQNLDNAEFAHVDNFKTPSPKRKRRKRTCTSPAAADKLGQEQANVSNERRVLILSNLRACALVAHLALSHPGKAFQACDLFPTVQSLHDQLVFFEDDMELQDTVAALCETWWRDHLPGRESLIAQSLPYLLSKSLEVGRKAHVHRVYNMREAFTLFDFVDESIEDLKHLLMRCVLTPAYLRSPDGRRFITFLFNLNPQLTKELIVMVKSQIPFGRKSILESYGEIIFRAWRTAEGPCLCEIEESCVQAIIEGAVYASSKTLSSSVRKILSSFTAQRTQEGVEALLFRLQEPILFRSLQVANSNVRRNALLLLIDMFPLENPDASKEENDMLLDRQFVFFDKLLSDPCPDVRITAVEGVCRVLRLFWEVLSSSTTVKLLNKLVDETAQDKSNAAVRCSVLQGMTYLLENPASHELLKVLLPKLGSLFSDYNLAVRIAVVDMLLALKGIRAIPFLKVVNLEVLLSALETDKSPVARRLTRLLIPSYFPSKVSISEACNRCVALIKRSPQAGARFLECAISEGVSSVSLLELIKTLIAMLSSPDGLDNEGREAILLSLNKLCSSLTNLKELKGLLGDLLTKETLKLLLASASTSASRTSIVQLISVINPLDVPELFDYCNQLLTCSSVDSIAPINSNEARAVHSLMLAWGGFDHLIQTLITLLNQDILTNSELLKMSSNGHASKKHKSDNRLGKSPWTKSIKKKGSSVKGKKTNNDSGQVQQTDSLRNAVTAAWHVENLLEVDDTRKALLAHESLPAVAVALRCTVQTVMQHTLSLAASDFLKSSPVRAYTTLMIHMVVMKKSGKRSSAINPEESIPSSDDPIMRVSKELVEWAESLQNFSQPSSPIVSTKKGGKHQRSSRSSRQRVPLTDISNNAASDTSSTCSCEVETFLGRLKLSNTSLESLLYFFSLNLVTDTTIQDSCLELSVKLLHWVMGWLKVWEGEQLSSWKKDSNSLLKDLQFCVRSSSAHVAKLLYLILRNDIGMARKCADLANLLMDLVIYSDVFFGSKGALSFLTALKAWIPDIFISISSLVTAIANDESIDDSLIQGLDLFADFGKRSVRPWISSFVNVAFEAVDFDLGNKTSTAIEEEVSENPQYEETSLNVEQMSSFAMSFLEKIGKMLRKGNPTVQEGILTLFLWHACMSMKDEKYDSAVGALDIVHRRFLMCEDSLRKGVKLTLSELSMSPCEEISKYADELLEEAASSETERKTLYKIKELAEDLLSCSSFREELDT